MSGSRREIAPDVTGLLQEWRAGDGEALARVYPMVYGELRRLAASYLQRERPGHTLQPTALVHEAYLKLADKERPRWRGRGHFLAVAARLMRRVLVDHARERKAVKRGGDQLRVTLRNEGPAVQAGSEGEVVDLLALHEGLELLAERDLRKAQIIERRFFGGLTLEEVGELLGLAVPTVVKEGRLARAWLHRELTGEGKKRGTAPP